MTADRPMLETADFYILLAANALFAVCYLIFGLVRAHQRKKNDRWQDGDVAQGIWIKTIAMLCFPVVLPLFFITGRLFHLLFFHRDVDLADIIFSKERVKTFAYADEEREMNMAPLEEAIAVSDNDSLRTLMLNVVRGDIGKSLRSISLALNSDDSETAHYAASVLCDELNNFRTTVQRLYVEIKKEDEKCFSYIDTLMPYMNDVLEQQVFLDLEQEKFTLQMEEILELLYQRKKELVAGEYYEWICSRLLEIENYELCEKWAKRGAQECPQRLGSYTSRLKLYFTLQNREQFFAALDELKASEIVIDQETLELIRVFISRA